MAKKITIVLIFILTGLATFLAGYLFNRHPLAENSGQEALLNNSLISRFNKIPEKYSPPTGLFALSKEGASFPALSADGKELSYYVPRTGEIRAVKTQDLSGGSTLLSKIQPGAQKIGWASNETLIADYADGKIYYDLDSGFSKKLDSKIKSPVLSKSGDKIAYNYFDENEGVGEIRISDSKLETFKKIMLTRFENWQIGWLNAEKLFLIKPPGENNPAYWLFTLDINAGKLEKVLNAESALEILWSPSGRKLAYSGLNAFIQTGPLYLLDPSSGDNPVEIDVPTGASRCTWSIDNKTLYCATPDSFITLDTSSAIPAAKNIFNPTQGNINAAAANASTLLLSSSEDYLFFKDSDDGKLYGLRLNQ